MEKNRIKSIETIGSSVHIGFLAGAFLDGAEMALLCQNDAVRRICERNAIHIFQFVSNSVCMTGVRGEFSLLY